MAKSVYNPIDNQELIDRIEKLHVDSTPLWGKMNVAQMLGHCNRAIEVGTGLLELRRSPIGFVFGRMALKSLMNKPIKRNLPTEKSFIIPTDAEFYKGKETLVQSYKQLLAQGPEMLSVKKHPFFGEMNDDQWDVLLWKHLDHHLQQFGV